MFLISKPAVFGGCLICAFGSNITLFLSNEKKSLLWNITPASLKHCQDQLQVARLLFSSKMHSEWSIMSKYKSHNGIYIGYTYACIMYTVYIYTHTHAYIHAFAYSYIITNLKWWYNCQDKLSFGLDPDLVKDGSWVLVIRKGWKSSEMDSEWWDANGRVKSVKEVRCQWDFSLGQNCGDVGDGKQVNSIQDLFFDWTYC